MVLDLTQLKPGQNGIVVDIQGGEGVRRRLERMGVRAGKKIIKMSAQVWRGPQTVKVDNINVAVGFGMAKKILIKVEK